MNVILPAAEAIGEGLKLLAEFAPEIETLVHALTKHGVDRDEYNATMRDLILKASAARMHSEFPDEAG